MSEPKYMVVACHHPMYNPSAWFEMEPIFMNWYFFAWLVGMWLFFINPWVITNVQIYKRLT